MTVTNDKRREVAAKVRETMGELGQVELDGIPLADLIEPEECDGCEPGAWEVVAMEVAERLGVAVGGCLPSDYADAIDEALDRRLIPDGMEWLLDVWPKWSSGEYCKFGDWWKSDKYGEFEPQQLRKLSIYTPEQLREWGQDDGDHFGYEWDFMRPSNPTYRPDKVEPPAPKVFDADGAEVHKGDEVWSTTGEFDGARTVRSVISDDDDSPPYAMFEERGEPWSCLCCCLTHRAPVLAADGRPLRNADVRERIVRCRDCEHAYEIDGADELNCLYFNDWDYRNDCPDEWRVEPDGFCAWGEERGDDRD